MKKNRFSLPFINLNLSCQFLINFIFILLSFHSSLLCLADPMNKKTQSQDTNFTPHWGFDLGASLGSLGGISYYEANFGINYHFKHWANWRNAFFGRWMDDSPTTYGLDTSLRAILEFKLLSSLHWSGFAGPGYRFINVGTTAPFLEGGMIFKLGGFSLGGGIKYLFNELINKNSINDTQYFLILTGSS